MPSDIINYQITQKDNSQVFYNANESAVTNFHKTKINDLIPGTFSGQTV
jgi:hypothetical protein